MHLAANNGMSTSYSRLGHPVLILRAGWCCVCLPGAGKSNHPSCTITPQDMLCGGGRLLDARRATTVAKAVGLSALQADSGTALGLLTVLGRLLARQQRLAAMLEHEPGTPSGTLAVNQCKMQGLMLP
jgi:hypothetical protein